MDAKRKKELLEEYKNRRPEMGVISIRCAATGESFLGISTDTRADLNSSRVKLSMNYHPNARLQALWKQYGEDAFELTVLKTLAYDDPRENQKPALEKLREKCLGEDPRAERLWR